jgi:hypothetical protein
MLCMIRSTIVPMPSLNSLGYLPAAAHTIVPEHTHQHNTHKRRRCTLPAASENDEAGPSRSVEIPVPYLRTRRCRDPLLAASVVQQDSSSGFQGSSNASLRTQRTLNHDRQLRKSIHPCCPNNSSNILLTNGKVIDQTSYC